MPRWNWHGPREVRFERGELKYLFLDLLAERPRHGYDLIRAIEERSGGAYGASPGAVYPTLQLLEDLGLVEATHADGRKTYTVTDAGRAYLAEHAVTVAEVRRRLTGEGGDCGGHEAWHALAREVAAFGQLLGHQRWRRRGLAPEAITRLVEILARARREIETVLDEGA